MTWFTYFCSWDIPINQGKKGLSYYILDLLISGITVRLTMIINSPQPQRRRILNPTFFFLSPTVFFNRKNFLINELLNGLPNDPEVQNGLMKFEMGQWSWNGPMKLKRANEVKMGQWSLKWQNQIKNYSLKFINIKMG